MDKFLSDLVEDVRDDGEETAAAGDQESTGSHRSQHNKQCYTNGMNHTGYLLEIGLKGIPLFLIQTLRHLRAALFAAVVPPGPRG